MKARIPPGTREERIAFMHGLVREAQLARLRVKYSRRQRRTLVAIFYVLVAGMVVILPGEATASKVGVSEHVGVLLLMVAPPLLLTIISGAVGGLAPRKHLLDERERAQRDRATAVGYRLLSVAVVISTVYAMVGITKQFALPLPSTAAQLFVFLVPLYFLALSLPVAVLAWTLPDPEPGPEPV